MGIPAGLVSDRYGARTLSVVFRLLCGASVLGYVLVDGFVSFLVAAAAFAVLSSAAGTATSALVGTVLEPAERVHGRAYMRVVSNLGVAVGAVGGGLVLRANSAAAYDASLVASGLAIGLSGLMYLLLTRRFTQPRLSPRG